MQLFRRYAKLGGKKKNFLAVKAIILDVLFQRFSRNRFATARYPLLLFIIVIFFIIVIGFSFNFVIYLYFPSYTFSQTAIWLKLSLIF